MHLNSSKKLMHTGRNPPRSCHRVKVRYTMRKNSCGSRLCIEVAISTSDRTFFFLPLAIFCSSSVLLWSSSRAFPFLPLARTLRSLLLFENLRLHGCSKRGFTHVKFVEIFPEEHLLPQKLQSIARASLILTSLWSLSYMEMRVMTASSIQTAI